MKRTMQAWLAGAAWILGGAALAQPPPGPTGQEAQQAPGGKEKVRGQQGETTAQGSQAGAVEPKKHLAEVEVYLRDAIANTKVIYQLTQWPAGRMDKTFIRDGATNIDRAIGAALSHVNHVKTLPEARVSDTEDVTSLQTSLTQARALAVQLRKVAQGGSSNAPIDRPQFASLASQIYTHLTSADADFDKIAKAADAPRIDRINVSERQPVRGGGEQEEQQNLPQPGNSVPGGGRGGR